MSYLDTRHWLCDYGECKATAESSADAATDPKPPAGWGRHVVKWEAETKTLHFCPECKARMREWGVVGKAE